jgi:CDP-6-deoxy-D-xylo-4-hexulose-3-dehydrase
LIKQPAFLDIKKRQIGDLKNTDLIMNNTFFIGLFPGIGKAQIDYVLEVFGEFFKRT